MAYRDPIPEDFIGRTIVDVTHEAVNYIVLHFEDGCHLEIGAEEAYKTRGKNNDTV